MVSVQSTSLGPFMTDKSDVANAEPYGRRWQKLFSWMISNRGLLYLVTRYGSTRYRGLAFEGNYRRGRWDLAAEGADPDLVYLVRRHAGGGRVLELGCGTGRLAGSIPPDTWTTFTGMDLAPSAISRAQARALPRATFVEADFEKELPSGPFDLIISNESLYYVASNRLPGFVESLERGLAPEGKLLVTLADPQRFQGLIRLLMQRFHLVERGPLVGNHQEYLVLQREVHS